VSVSGSYPHQAKDIRPAIFTILSKSAGAGYPNVLIDDDGVLRRIDLLTEFEGKYYPQLSFAVVLDILGRPDVVVSPRQITLKRAMLPGTDKPRDIRLPLEDHDYFLLNWLAGEYMSSFRHLSFYTLLEHKKIEDTSS
jgi:adenylate cyclase